MITRNFYMYNSLSRFMQINKKPLWGSKYRQSFSESYREPYSFTFYRIQNYSTKKYTTEETKTFSHSGNENGWIGGSTNQRLSSQIPLGSEKQKPANMQIDKEPYKPRKDFFNRDKLFIKKDKDKKQIPFLSKQTESFYKGENRHLSLVYKPYSLLLLKKLWFIHKEKKRQTVYRTQKKIQYRYPFSDLIRVLFKRKNSGRRISYYKELLIERKKLSLLYGNLSVKTLRKIVYRCKQIKGSFEGNLYKLLESRLDASLLRISFYKTFKSARVGIRNGEILVNNTPVFFPGYILKPGDIIRVEAGKKKVLKKEILKTFKEILENKFSRTQRLESSLLNTLFGKKNETPLQQISAGGLFNGSHTLAKQPNEAANTSSVTRDKQNSIIFPFFLKKVNKSKEEKIEWFDRFLEKHQNTPLLLYNGNFNKNGKNLYHWGVFYFFKKIKVFLSLNKTNYIKNTVFAGLGMGGVGWAKPNLPKPKTNQPTQNCTKSKHIPCSVKELYTLTKYKSVYKEKEEKIESLQLSNPVQERKDGQKFLYPFSGLVSQSKNPYKLYFYTIYKDYPIFSTEFLYTLRDLERFCKTKIYNKALNPNLLSFPIFLEISKKVVQPLYCFGFSFLMQTYSRTNQKHSTGTDKEVCTKIERKEDKNRYFNKSLKYIKEKKHYFSLFYYLEYLYTKRFYNARNRRFWVGKALLLIDFIIKKIKNQKPVSILFLQKPGSFLYDKKESKTVKEKTESSTKYRRATKGVSNEKERAFKDKELAERVVEKIFFLKTKRKFFYSKKNYKNLRLTGFRVSAQKPLNFEISYKNLSAIFLYSPQRIVYPSYIDFLKIKHFFRA